MVVSIWLSLGTAGAANWYIDSKGQAPNDGSTWASAWTNFASMSWDRLNPGDTVLIAGGVYTNGPRITKGGKPDAPITLRPSRELGHSGDVYLRGSISTRYDWITLDGSVEDAYAATVITNTVNVPLITNNIAFHICGHSAVDYHGNGPHGLRILWCDLSTSSDDPETYGVRINASGTKDMMACEIGYCWIHDLGQDGVKQFNGVTNPDFDRLVIHHCVVERPGDDGLEINQGTTVHHCIIRDTRRLHGHPDGIQSVGTYQRYYNNIISDFTSSYILTQGVQSKEGVNGPVQIYGNLLIPNRIPCSSTMVELKWFPMGWNVQSSISYSNWVVVNNTFVGSTNGNFGFYKRDYLLTNATLRAVQWVNNITWNAYGWVGGIPHGRDRAGTGSWDGRPGDVYFDYNIIANDGGHRLVNEFSIFGQKWPDADAMSKATIYKHNTSARPRFVNPSRRDFRLAPTDSVARNTGLDLSSLHLPGLERDLYGGLRGAKGKWDRGAIESF